MRSDLQAILPVAGLGTRFLPWTKAVPKEMLPIGNRPIISLLVDECLEAGIDDICFVISKGKEAIPQYFAQTPVLERELAKRGKTHLLGELTRYQSVRFTVVHQDEQLGDGHALLRARNWVNADGMVAILFGDDLIAGPRSGLRQLLDAHQELPGDDGPACVIGLEEVPMERVSQYGVVEFAPGWAGADIPFLNARKIRTFVEKPRPEEAPSNLGVVGRYLVPSSLFSVLESVGSGSHGGEIRLIDAFIAARGRIDVYGSILEGIRFDTGTPEGYRRAARFFDRDATPSSETFIPAFPEQVLA